MPALETAMNRIAERHEALLTTFRRDVHGVAQYVNPAAPRRHEHHDLRDFGALAASEAWRIAEVQFAELFDLERGPLWRTMLFQVDDNEHLLSIQLHHIVSDAWSRSIWMEELGEHYAAAIERRPPIVPQLTTQPAVLAKAQRAVIARGDLNPQREFWRRTLEGIPPGVELPTTRRRPMRPSYRATFVELRLSSHLTPPAAGFWT